MDYYPIGFCLEGRRCLVIGGGRIALAKARGLVEAGACVTVVGREFVAEFDSLAGVERHGREFSDDDLTGVALAIAATDDPAVNHHVAETCRVRGIAYNVVDDPDYCGFIVPSILRRGPLTVSIATGGAAPALARRLRRQLEAWLPEDYAEYVEFLDHARQRAKTAIADPKRRFQIATQLATEDGYQQFRRRSPPEREQWLSELLGEQ